MERERERETQLLLWGLFCGKFCRVVRHEGYAFRIFLSNSGFQANPQLFLIEDIFGSKSTVTYLLGD
jgi:hypothetical protein